MGYLRILLALCVAVGHLPSGVYAAPDSTIIFVGAIVAVKLFFIISGFYMAMIFHKHYSTAPMFFVSRAVRLFPAYWLTIAFCVAAAFWLKTPHLGLNINLDFWYFVRSSLPLFLVTLSNLTFLGIDFGYFICVHAASAPSFAFAWSTICPDGRMLLLSGAVVPPAWTLSLEWYFYLLVPLFCAMSTRRVVLVTGFSFLLAALIALFANVQPWNRAFFPAELYLFLLGFLAYRLKHLIPAALGWACAALVAVTILAYQHIPGFDWQAPVSANFVLYFALAIALPTLFANGSQIPGERLAGDLSYPIYICHWPVEAVMFSLLLHERMSLAPWIAANVLVVIIASTLLLIVTAPIEKFRRRFKSRQVTLTDHDSGRVRLVK
jgi:peptidoglycan/LPS O-acetylase OafA/YrhL